MSASLTRIELIDSLLGFLDWHQNNRASVLELLRPKHCTFYLNPDAPTNRLVLSITCSHITLFRPIIAGVCPYAHADLMRLWNRHRTNIFYCLDTDRQRYFLNVDDDPNLNWRVKVLLGIFKTFLTKYQSFCQEDGNVFYPFS